MKQFLDEKTLSVSPALATSSAKEGRRPEVRCGVSFACPDGRVRRPIRDPQGLRSSFLF